MSISAQQRPQQQSTACGPALKLLNNNNDDDDDVEIIFDADQLQEEEENGAAAAITSSGAAATTSSLANALPQRRRQRNDCAPSVFNITSLSSSSSSSSSSSIHHTPASVVAGFLAQIQMFLSDHLRHGAPDPHAAATVLLHRSSDAVRSVGASAALLANIVVQNHARGQGASASPFQFSTSFAAKKKSSSAVASQPDDALDVAIRVALSEWAELAVRGAIWSNCRRLADAGAFLLRLSAAKNTFDRVTQAQGVPPAPAAATFAVTVLIDSAAAAIERCFFFIHPHRGGGGVHKPPQQPHQQQNHHQLSQIIEALSETIFPAVIASSLVDPQSIGRQLAQRLLIAESTTTSTTSSSASSTAALNGNGNGDPAACAALLVAGCWMAALEQQQQQQQQEQDAHRFQADAELVAGQVAIALRSRLTACRVHIRRALRLVNATTASATSIATALSKALVHWSQAAPSRRAFLTPPDPHSLQFDLLASAAGPTSTPAGGGARSNTSSPLCTVGDYAAVMRAATESQQPVRHFHFGTPSIAVGHHQHHHQQHCSSAGVVSCSTSPLQQ